MIGSLRARVASLVLAAAFLALVPSARAGWQAPHDILGKPLDTGSFLYPPCDQTTCPAPTGVNGIFRMVGPRSGVGVISLPVLEVFNPDRSSAPAGAVPAVGNAYRYGVDFQLYGVSLAGGSWSVTPLGGGPITDDWSEPGADIAPDGNGGAMVVYQAGVGKDVGASVWARKVTGGVWGPATQLTGPLPLRSFSAAPRVAVLPNGGAIAVYTEPNGGQWAMTFSRFWNGSVWQPQSLVETGPVWPDSHTLASASDGTTVLAYGAEPLQGTAGTLGVRTGGAAGFDLRIDGETRPDWMGQMRAVAGPGGTGLVVDTGDDSGLHAQSLAGGVLAAPVTVAPGYQASDDFFSLSGTPQSATLVWVQGGWPSGNSAFIPSQRHIFAATLGPSGWSAPQDIGGGLANPAPYSEDLTNDVAAGGGIALFAAGALSEDLTVNEQRVYAASLGTGGWSAPQAIDNGPGGTVHVVAADAEAGGTGAALFTQLDSSGNVRLYGVEDLPNPGFTRPPMFGRVLCTDATSVVAGCVTAQLDPVHATLATPKIEPDTSVALSGSVKLAARPRSVASAARTTKATAQIALERTTKHSCSWWSVPRRRFVTGSCGKPRFTTVKVSGSHWKLRIGRLGTGAVTVWARAASGTRVQQVFKLKSNKRAITVTRRKRA